MPWWVAGAKVIVILGRRRWEFRSVPFHGNFVLNIDFYPKLLVLSLCWHWNTYILLIDKYIETFINSSWVSVYKDEKALSSLILYLLYFPLQCLPFLYPSYLEIIFLVIIKYQLCTLHSSLPLFLHGFYMALPFLFLLSFLSLSYHKSVH